MKRVAIRINPSPKYMRPRLRAQTYLIKLRLALTQILIFWRTNKSIAIVQLAMRSGRIRVNYHILAVIIPVV